MEARHDRARRYSDDLSGLFIGEAFDIDEIYRHSELFRDAGKCSLDIGIRQTLQDLDLSGFPLVRGVAR
jgi:hypothetical protein